MTLGWPWPILRQSQIWLHRLLYGRKWKLLSFGTYCSLRSQSCLKLSAKWVNEVEWVSKINVILWPWSKVTQISKLNVWLFVCILRWAIQDLMALLLTYMGMAAMLAMWPSPFEQFFVSPTAGGYFGQNWSRDFRGEVVWKCGWTTTDYGASLSSKLPKSRRLS